MICDHGNIASHCMECLHEAQDQFAEARGEAPPAPPAPNHRAEFPWITKAMLLADAYAADCIAAEAMDEPTGPHQRRKDASRQALVEFLASAPSVPPKEGTNNA